MAFNWYGDVRLWRYIILYMGSFSEALAVKRCTRACVFKCGDAQESLCVRVQSMRSPP